MGDLQEDDISELIIDATLGHLTHLAGGPAFSPFLRKAGEPGT